VQNTLGFPDLLRLIDERSSAFVATVSSAPSLDVVVPSCPEWSLFDLVEHLGQGRRRWAATVAAGPADAPPSGFGPQDAAPAPRDRDELVAWMATSTQLLQDALRASGPDRGCWTWWGTSQSPQTAGAVARHQLQQVAVHTYDAQLALGGAQPLPGEVALDGVEEFLFTCVATTSAWPHPSAVVDYHATEGRSWRIWLSADGARTARLPGTGDRPGTGAAPEDGAAHASARGTASELVLFMYGRLPVDAMQLDGRQVFDQLIAWEPA
jgi:uncharacterized protein (TIGR03083 family)